MRNAERGRSLRKVLAAGSGAAAVVLVAGSVGGASAAPGPTDLELTKSDSADPVVEQGSFAYTVQVRNLGAGGTADATDVVVTDTLPTGVTYSSATTTNGTCDRANRTVTCQLGTLNAGASATVTINVKAGKDGTVSNTASVATTVADGTPANNQDTETTTISNAPATPKKPRKPKKVKGTGCAAPSISGTPGNDVLRGTPGVDVIRGFAGNDTILAGGGNDIVCGDFGNDIISGGPGADTLVGSGGRDRIVGGGGSDLIRRKAGADRLRGQGGHDKLVGGSSTRDRCGGGSGRDVLKSCP